MTNKLSRLILLPCLLVLQGSLSAQHVLTKESNGFRAGDYLTKRQVEYVDAGIYGRNLVWDFRWLQTVNDEYILEYSGEDSLICGTEHNTRYYYQQTANHLFATGYENNATLMKYTQPEVKFRFPFAYGDTLYSEFEGRGEYGRRMSLFVKGWTRVHADAEGDLILPDQTVKKALRVHTLRHYTENKGSQAEITLDTYSWYAQGVRYPVFESVKTIFHEKGTYKYVNEYYALSSTDTAVFAGSFYYPPELQLSETDIQTSVDDDPASVFTEAQLAPNPVVDNLYISYKLTRNAHIGFSLHNQSGIVLASKPSEYQSEGEHQTSISMAGFVQGIYTLYVYIDDMQLSLNVIKQ